MKNTIKLNEVQLKKMVGETIKSVLKESSKEYSFKEETIDAIHEAYNALNGLHGLLRHEIYPIETELCNEAKELDEKVISCMFSLGQYIFHI